MEEPAPLRWSSALPVITPSAIATKNLRGDKILLPQSALEQLLAAARSRPSTTTARSDPWSYSSSDADTAQQLPNPLIFRLVNPKNKNAVFAGIREFSASEGTLGLSPWLTEALGIQEDECVSPKEVIDLEQDTAQNSERMDVDGIQIKVEARQLPKGTYVRLRPLEAGYNPDDWKPLLERQLRENFTTLSKGSMLAVKGARGEEFKLLVDKVAPEGDGICVVDTDLEVDIEALDEEQARETLRRIMSAQRGSTDGSSTGGEIDIWKAVEGQVLESEYVDYVLPSWNKSQPLAIELTTGEDEDALDLFVTPKSSRQRALPRERVHVFGDFSPAVDGVKRIVISPTNVELEGAEQITISVHGYRHPDATESPRTLQYSLRAKVDLQDAKDGTNGLSNGAGEQEHSPDEEQCSNCLQFVPKRTMVLHENFCRRNNVVCPNCKSVFKKGSPEWEAHWHCEKDSAFGNSTQSKAKHDDIFHTERQCPNCEFSTNSMADLARHQTSVCPGKLILCRFCHLEVPQEGDPFNPSPEVVLSGLTAHELADGTRTTECHLCDKIVRLKDMETHLKHHELDKVSRLKPPICRNANCGRTMFGVGSRGQVRQTASTDQASNDIGLCSICFGPLYVSMHDPEGKALKRRIERRYLGQLMTGCGKSHCANPWCKTGRANAGLEAKPSSAREVLPLVKPLLGDVTNMDAPLWFCTDEGSQRGRKLAEMMAEEGVWDAEWCIAAAEAEKGSLERMRDWLQAWAPTK
ncbi:Ubiquitin fusion degradation protein 1-like protein [Fusarium oxysporum f. sp. cubense]|uniref:Ubiquitin fusion degradation protein 1-like protein n=1 Tax=Fusarium oxysporum f. sp. cubense TaxID=61366 RepID=A0A559KQL9_FUSOC|nr:Ubiquitin fusion degradation protein 1-like protein [Fusarium oxysporum f. sp. cubense]